eukprot:14747921-Alexandrium_andersonii.AAC.1
MALEGAEEGIPVPVVPLQELRHQLRGAPGSPGPNIGAGSPCRSGACAGADAPRPAPGQRS